MFVVFQGFQVGDHFCRPAQFHRQTFFERSCQSMRLPDRRRLREQQVHFNEIPVSRGAAAHAMIMHSKFVADCVELLADLLIGFRV